MSSVLLTPPEKAPQGEIVLSGSKSFTNRALVAATLASGESELLYPSDSNDTELFLNAVRALGIEVHEGPTSLRIVGTGGKLPSFSGEIDIGPAGTTSRFLLSVLAHIPEGEVLLHGTERMHERPIGILVDALRSLGADIEYRGKEGCLPVLIRGVGGLKGSTVEVDASMSSQFLSSLLLLAPCLDDGLTLVWEGELISKSYIQMTLEALADFGVDAILEDQKLVVPEAASYSSARYRVEGDASGGSYFWGLAAVTGGEVLVRNISSDSTQGDAQFPYELKKMGCEVFEQDDGVLVKGASELLAITTDMELMPDTAQTLSVVAAFAKGTTNIAGLSTLKVKETDRLVALNVELAKVGIETEITDESIAVTGGSPVAAKIATYHDHRMAMSFALLGARIPGVEICDVRVVDKSFPTFWEKLQSFGIGVEQR